MDSRIVLSSSTSLPSMVRSMDLPSCFERSLTTLVNLLKMLAMGCILVCIMVSWSSEVIMSMRWLASSVALPFDELIPWTS